MWKDVMSRRAPSSALWLCADSKHCLEGLWAGVKGAAGDSYYRVTYPGGWGRCGGRFCPHSGICTLPPHLRAGPCELGLCSCGTASHSGGGVSGATEEADGSPSRGAVLPSSGMPSSGRRLDASHI